MMAIPNLADWFAPTATTANEATAEPEVLAQTEFAALLAASYTALPTTSAPTWAGTNASEATTPKSEAVPTAAEFLRPADMLPPVAAKPILTGAHVTDDTKKPITTGARATDETIRVFSDVPRERILLPLEPLAKTTVATNGTARNVEPPALVLPAGEPALVNAQEPLARDHSAETVLGRPVAQTSNLPAATHVENFGKSVAQAPNLPTVRPIENREKSVAQVPNLPAVAHVENFGKSVAQVPSLPAVAQVENREKSVAEAPSLPATAQVENLRDEFSPRLTTATQAPQPRDESSFFPKVAAQQEQPYAADGRVPEREVLSASTSSNPVVAPHRVVPTSDSFFALPLAKAAAPPVAIDNMPREAFTPSPPSQEERRPVRIESAQQVVTAPKELTAATAERLPPVLAALPQGNSDALKLAVAAVKSLVTESRAELPPPLTVALASEPTSTVNVAPLVFAAEAAPRAAVNEVVNREKTLPIAVAPPPEVASSLEIAPPPEIAPLPKAAPPSQAMPQADALPQPQVVPTPTLVSDFPADIVAQADISAAIKRVDARQPDPVAVGRHPIAAEPIASQLIAQPASDPLPKATSTQVPTNVAPLDAATESGQIKPTPVSQLSVEARQPDRATIGRPSMVSEPVVARLAAQPASASWPAATSTQVPKDVAPLDATTKSPQAAPLPVSKFAVAAQAPRDEVIPTRPLALPLESTTAEVTAAFGVEEIGAEAVPQPSFHRLVNALPLAEATVNREAEPLVNQTIPPVLELAQQLEAPATRSLRLQLNPAELGRVNVEVTRDAEGHIRAVLNVEQRDTAQTLTHSLGQLREGLERAGLVVERLDVTLAPQLHPQPFGQQFGQPSGQPPPQPHSAPNHFTNADSLPAEQTDLSDTARATDHKLLSMRA